MALNYSMKKNKNILQDTLIKLERCSDVDNDNSIERAPSGRCRVPAYERCTPKRGLNLTWEEMFGTSVATRGI